MLCLVISSHFQLCERSFSSFASLSFFYPAVTEQHFPPVTVREGDEATLSCANRTDQVKCNRTSWAFNHYTTRAATDLVKHGQVVKNQISRAESDSESDRVSVSVNCSLIIQRVAADYVGRYFCSLLNYSGQELVQNTLDLSVVKSEFVYSNIFRHIWTDYKMYKLSD